MAISVDGDNQRDWIWWDHYPLHPDVQELQNYTVNIWKLTTDHCSCQLTHPVLGFYSVWLIWFKVSKVSVKTKRSVLYLFRALLKRVIRDYNTAIKGPIIKTIIHYLRIYEQQMCLPKNHLSKAFLPQICAVLHTYFSASGSVILYLVGNNCFVESLSIQ